jgi:2-oxoglutarate dehydrogenase E1 component
MGPGTTFQRYIPEPHPESLHPPEEIKRHILCSGQVYYALVQERNDRKLPVAISRVEQISPVPYDLLTPHLDKYPNADIMWAQEEPVNKYVFVLIRLKTGQARLNVFVIVARGRTCSLG